VVTCGTNGTTATVVVVVGTTTVVVVTGARVVVVTFVVTVVVFVVVAAAVVEEAVMEDVTAGVVDSSDSPVPATIPTTATAATAAPANQGHLRRFPSSGAVGSGCGEPGAPNTCVGSLEPPGLV
jgi:hypothetical protein